MQVLSVHEPHVVDLPVDRYIPVLPPHQLVKKLQRRAELAAVIVAFEGVRVRKIDGEVDGRREPDVVFDLKQFWAGHRQHMVHQVSVDVVDVQFDKVNPAVRILVWHLVAVK